MKITAYITAIVIVLTSASYGMTIGMGHFSDATLSNTTLFLSEDYVNGDLSLGLTMNANLSDKDYGMETAVVKYLEYDNSTFGVRYAPIEGLTFGGGLLLSDLNTMYYQPAFLRNENSGLRVYYDFDAFVLEGIGTYSHLYGVRMKDLKLFNLNIALECLSDAEQSSREAFGRSAYGAYVELPLTDEFSLFGEAATTSNGGAGSLGGISFDHDLLFAFSKIDIAAASFNDKFVPSYFTTGYDINPLDFSSLESGVQRQGTIICLDSGIMGAMNIRIINENYTDGGSATSGSLLFTPVAGLNLICYVKEFSFSDMREIKGKDGNLVGGTMEYRLGNGANLSVNYKKSPPVADSKQYYSAYIKLGWEL